MGVVAPKEFFEHLTQETTHLLSRVDSSKNNESIDGSQFVTVAQNLAKEYHSVGLGNLDQNSILVKSLASCLCSFDHSAILSGNWKTDASKHADLKRALDTSLEVITLVARLSEVNASLSGSGQSSPYTPRSVGSFASDCPPPSPKAEFESSNKSEAESPPASEPEYDFKPLLNFGSKNIEFRSSLNPLIQQLPKTFGLADGGVNVDLKVWRPCIAAAVKEIQRDKLPPEARPPLVKSNKSVSTEDLKKAAALKEEFNRSDTGEKLSKLLDDNQTVLIQMCLARVAQSELKSSSLGDIQKATSLEKNENATPLSPKLLKPTSWKNWVLNKTKGSADERRKDHQPIFNEVTEKVREYLLPKPSENHDQDIQELLLNKYREIVKTEPTPEDCKKLFNFALKCYAVGLVPRSQLLVNSRDGEGTALPEGSGLLACLLRAQTYLEKKQQEAPFGDRTVPCEDDGKPVYRAPNTEECQAFVKELEKGFGVPFALDVSDDSASTKSMPGYVPLLARFKQNVLLPLNVRSGVDLSNEDIKSFLSFIKKQVFDGFERFNTVANGKTPVGQPVDMAQRVGAYFEKFADMISSIHDGEPSDVKQRLTMMSAYFKNLKNEGDQERFGWVLVKYPTLCAKLLNWVNAGEPDDRVRGQRSRAVTKFFSEAVDVSKNYIYSEMLDELNELDNDRFTAHMNEYANQMEAQEEAFGGSGWTDVGDNPITPTVSRHGSEGNLNSRIDGISQPQLVVVDPAVQHA